MVGVQGLVNKAKGTDKGQIIAVILTGLFVGLGIYLLIRYVAKSNNRQDPSHPPVSLELFYDPSSGKVTIRGGTPLDIASFHDAPLGDGTVAMRRVLDGQTQWLRADLGTGALYVTTVPPEESEFAGEYGFAKRGPRLKPWRMHDLSIVPTGGVVQFLQDRAALARGEDSEIRFDVPFTQETDVRFGGHPGGLEGVDQIKYVTMWRFF